MASLGFVALLLLAQTGAALAATAPPMGVVQQFGVLGATGVTATNPVVVTGDVGSSPTATITGSVTVVPPFTLHTTNDAVVQQAQLDATAAVSGVGGMTSQACTTDLTGQDLGTVGTLTPGVYCFTAAAGLTGTLTLNGSGVYIFKIGTTLTTADSSNVALNGADSGNVFWRVGSAADLGVSSTFRGNIFAGTSIGLGSGASLVGRAVAQTGAVTLDGSVSVPLPSITITKSVAAYSDPANGTTNPKAIPGSEMLYTITMTNSGSAVDNNTTVVTDPIPANTALYVSDINGAGSGSGPVRFTDGTPVSGLTYTFTALGNLGDDVDFSSNNGTTWAYVPTPGADGCDPLVTNLRINPKGAFAGNATPPNPGFSLNFRVCVK